MNVNNAFPSQYLKASDLGTNVVIVTIAHVTIEPVGQNKDQKPVVYFEGKQKGMVLNRINSKKITEIAGTPETDEWTGVRVALFATTTEFAGDTVECLRVKVPLPQRVVAPKPPAPKLVTAPAEFDGSDITDDDIPF